MFNRYTLRPKQYTRLSKEVKYKIVNNVEQVIQSTFQSSLNGRVDQTTVLIYLNLKINKNPSSLTEAD